MRHTDEEINEAAHRFERLADELDPSVSAAFAGWLGGRVITGLGLPSIYLVGALPTVAGPGHRARIRVARPPNVSRAR